MKTLKEIFQTNPLGIKIYDQIKSKMSVLDGVENEPMGQLLDTQMLLDRLLDKTFEHAIETNFRMMQISWVMHKDREEGKIITTFLIEDLVSSCKIYELAYAQWEKQSQPNVPPPGMPLDVKAQLDVMEKMFGKGN